MLAYVEKFLDFPNDISRKEQTIHTKQIIKLLRSLILAIQVKCATLL